MYTFQKWNLQSPGMSSVSYLGSQPARICSKKLREWTAMLLVEALAFNKCFLGEMKYIYKMKSLKGHYTITLWKAELSKKKGLD